MLRWIPAVSLAALLPALAAAQDRAPESVSSVNGMLQVERLATLEYPWGMAYLPDGRLLVTEKPGRLRIFANGKLSDPIRNMPPISYLGTEKEQGGLLDVAVDPDFARNRFIYLSFSEAVAQQPAELGESGDARFGDAIDESDRTVRGGAVARAVLEEDRLEDVRVIWRQVPKTVGRGHFGNRLVWDRDGALFVTSGDRMRFEPAQSEASNLGKVVRINTDGSIPNDNPLAGRNDALADIWSLGHRNILSAAVNPESGKLWVWEMGPLGGDELNIIEPGKNYGWPLVSSGDHYNNATIPPHPARDEFEAPVRTWTPVISPSGAVFYDGDLLPWRGDALIGALTTKELVRLTVAGTRVVNEERIDMQRRVRDVIQAPDGAVLLITDHSDGELLRLAPAAGRSAGAR
jgi:aldose sugar dehydrogenase